jgi:putative ABC transport system permease protein
MPGLYLPATQWSNGPAAFIVRADGDPLALANAIRGQVRAMDSDIPVSDVETMEDIVAAPQGQLRLMMQLLGAFAVAATLLAIIGLCGVISYSVVRRTKEIGIRCALGAPRHNIISLVMGQGLGLSLVGVFLGACAAFAATRVLRDFLFEVQAVDPLTFAGIAILFIVVAMFASYIPAHKAIRIDPMAALRTE